MLLNNTYVKEQSTSEISKYFQLSGKFEHNLLKFVKKKKLIALMHILEKKKSQINNLSFHFREPQKRAELNPK